MKNLISIFSVCFVMCGCSSTLSRLAIKNADKILDIAIEVGCAAAASEGCMDDEKIVKVFGSSFGTSESCTSTIKDSVDSGIISIDLDKLASRRMTCRKFTKALGL